MRFEKCMGWRVTFRDLADSSKQFREITFADSGKIDALIARTLTRMVWRIAKPSNTGYEAV